MTRTLPQTCTRCESEALPTCFYCGNMVAKRHEHDHYPVPARAGGAHTVPACYNCHDLKDRVRTEDWNAIGYVEAVVNLIRVLDIDAAQLTKEQLTDQRECLALLLAAVVRNLDLHTTPRWAALSTSGRILFAKLACLTTGDYPIEDEEQRINRRDLLAPWVDPASPRYRDAIDHMVTRSML